MIEIISGIKGKGKTKILITKANDSALLSKGSIVFLDKNNKHIFELSNQIRMINVPEFGIDNFDKFCGFLCGIVSQDHDLEKIFLDSFLTIAHIDDVAIEDAIAFLENFSETHEVDIMISLSKDKEEMTDYVQQFISISL